MSVNGASSVAGRRVARKGAVADLQRARLPSDGTCKVNAATNVAGTVVFDEAAFDGQMARSAGDAGADPVHRTPVHSVRDVLADDAVANRRKREEIQPQPAAVIFQRCAAAGRIGPASLDGQVADINSDVVRGTAVSIEHAVDSGRIHNCAGGTGPSDCEVFRYVQVTCHGIVFKLADNRERVGSRGHVDRVRSA